jgi:hypothetical protein
VRTSDQPRDVHAAGLKVDHEPDDVADETAEGEDLDGEEVGRGDHAEVRLEESLPRHRLAALGRGLHAMLGQDALDRVAAELVIEVAERAADPRVAPSWVANRTTSCCSEGVVPRPLPLRWAVPSYFFAMSSRYQRRIVSGVTRPASCSKTRRPRTRPFTASRRRWASVKRRRRSPSCSRSTRFSS